MIIFFSIFFTLYGALNYYIFIRGWQALEGHQHLRIIYLVLFILSAAAYLIAKFFTKYLPGALYDIFLTVGSYWFAFMIYFLLFVIAIDIVRLLNGQFNFFPEFVKQNYKLTKQLVFIAVFVLVSVIVLAGYINARNLKTKTLDLTLRKGESRLTELKAVMVSDIHLSPLNDGKFIGKIVEKINALNPDIVLIAGDLFDDHAQVLRERHIGRALFNLKPKYGVYACTGNHEFINGVDSAVAYMEDHGIKVLRDELLMIDSSFYIISRDDRSRKQFTGSDRKPLKELATSADKAYPLILLDHTPFGLQEAEDNNIDLQLSGHTHNGQMFPANLITKMVYEVSWGYKRKGKTQYYVSSGAGTWGPPVKLGNDAEIINLNIKFSD